MDGSTMSHWARMARSLQGASLNGLTLTLSSNPFDERVYGLFASLKGLYK